MQAQSYYIKLLKEHLSLKQRDNPHYSMRAYARDLKMHSSSLGQILTGKRALPLNRAHDIAEKLALAPKEKTLFMESFYRSKTSIDDIEINNLDERYLLDESYYKIISEWEHYAVLELFNLINFKIDKESVALKLSLTTNRAEVVLTNLIHCQLIIVNARGEFALAHPDIKTTEDSSSSALNKSHRETLKMGAEKLDKIEVELRDFSSTTVALDLTKLPEAKTIIREFRQKMTALLRGGKKTDVFQLAIQFYPLTTINTMENTK